jgi:hypothetical protein
VRKFLSRSARVAALVAFGLLSAPLRASSASPFTLDFQYDFIGGGAILSYHGLSIFPGVDTTLRFNAGCVYDLFGYGYFRTPQDRPYEGGLPGYDGATSPHLVRLVARSGLEVDQGLLWNERDQENALEAFLAYELRYEKNIKDSSTRQLVFDSDLPDRDQILQSSILAGVEWKDVDAKRPHHMISGLDAETSLEWGPSALFNSEIGDADFLRWNLSARAFMPLFDAAPSSVMNVFSVYLGAFVSMDYAFGGYVPLNVRESFGGRSPRKGLGYAVRGLEDCRYDTPLKAVSNLELRANLPAVFDPRIIPGLLVCLDIGYYNFINPPIEGFVASTGGGVFLSLFDFLDLTLTTHFLLNARKVTGGEWTPVFFNFVFHF